MGVSLRRLSALDSEGGSVGRGVCYSVLTGFVPSLDGDSLRYPQFSVSSQITPFNYPYVLHGSSLTNRNKLGFCYNLRGRRTSVSFMSWSHVCSL